MPFLPPNQQSQSTEGKNITCKTSQTTFQIDSPISLANAKNEKFQHPVRGGYYTALIYDVIHDISVLFTFA